jgi:CCR4-NOT transcription complex subunit 1
MPPISLIALPKNHDVQHIVRQMLALAPSSGDRQRIPLNMSQKVAQLLYKTPSSLGREIYVAVLEHMCQMFEEVANEVIPWLVESQDEVGSISSEQNPGALIFIQRKYNVPVTVTLLRSGLVTVAQLDQQTAKFLFADPRSSLQDYAAALIRECLVAEPPVATQKQFGFTLEAFVQLSQNARATEEFVICSPRATTPLTLLNQG